MEGFEKQAYVVYATIRDDGDEGQQSLRSQYDAKAAPLIRSGKLNGVITPDEVNARTDAALRRLSHARGEKDAHGTWADWKSAATEMLQVAVDLRDLRRELGAAVDAANEVEVARKRYWGAIIYGGVVGAILAVGLTALVAWLT